MYVKSIYISVLRDNRTNRNVIFLFPFIWIYMYIRTRAFDRGRVSKVKR